MNVAKPSFTPSARRRSLPPDTQAPPWWIAMAGVIFGGVTLLFFMAVAVAALFGHEVPAESRFLILVVLAFGAAMAAGFFGGKAAAKGMIPFTPIAVSTTGGVAVLVIVLLLGYYLYVEPTSPARSQIVTVVPSGVPRDFTIDNLSPDSLADVGQFRTIGDRQFLYVEFLPGKLSGRLRLTYPDGSGPGFKKTVYRVKTDGELVTQPEN
jgi:hypothetical protein